MALNRAGMEPCVFPAPISSRSALFFSFLLRQKSENAKKLSAKRYRIQKSLEWRIWAADNFPDGHKSRSDSKMKKITSEFLGGQEDSGTVGEEKMEDSSSFCEHHCSRPLKECKSPCLEGLTAAVQFIRRDAMVLSRQIARLDERAKKDVALISSQISVIEERAKSDALELDNKAKSNAKRLHHVALGLEESVSYAAMEHWNDGQLDADLRLADLRARRRALEDSFAALQFVKIVHEAVVSVLRNRDVREQKEGRNKQFVTSQEKPWSKLTTTERLIAFEEAYHQMLDPASEFDNEDSLDSDELEFIVAALVDLDGVGGASGSRLVTEAANSPDVHKRKAIAEALSSAPSVWALGNAGISALERLARDPNEAVARAADEALQGVKSQLEQSSLLTFPSNFYGGKDTESDSPQDKDIEDDNN